MRRSLVVVGTAAVAATLGSAPVAAQGSGVMTHGSCATALGAAGVANPCNDGSAILFNPAGIVNQPSVVGLGWTGITTGGAFTYDLTGERFERDETTTSVPFGYATYRVNDRLAVGIGAFAPYGLGLAWPEEFEGRYTSYDTELRNVYIQPTVAFRPIPEVSLGAGLDYVRASIDINQRVDLAGVPLPAGLSPFPGATFGNVGVPTATDFADVNLNGSGTGFGFHLGGIVQVGPMLSLGGRYMSKVEIDYSGTADFTQVNTGISLAGNALDPVLAAQFGTGGPLADQGLRTTLTLPAQAVVGFSLQPIRQVKIVGDYQWTEWSDFDQAPIDFESEASADQTLVLDYRNTDTYRIGAEVRPVEPLALRAGFIYNTAAQREFSVSPLLPEAERNYYSVGAGYQLNNGFGIDVGYQLIDQSDRRGRVRGRAPNATAGQLRGLNVGVYEADASVLNVTVSYRFGGR